MACPNNATRSKPAAATRCEAFTVSRKAGVLRLSRRVVTLLVWIEWG